MQKSFSKLAKNSAMPSVRSSKKRPGKSRQRNKFRTPEFREDSFGLEPPMDKDARLMLIADAVEARKAGVEAMKLYQSSFPSKHKKLNWTGCIKKSRKTLSDALFLAVRRTDVEKLSSLLKLGVPVDIFGKLGETIFMRAAGAGKIPLLEEILKHNPNLEARSKSRGDTALMWAAGAGKTPAIVILLNAGAKINARNNGKKTALMLAAGEGQSDTVSQLLKLGANPNLKDSTGRTALDYAKLEGHRKAIKFLFSSICSAF